MKKSYSNIYFLRLRVQLDDLNKPSGKREILEEKTNTSKFLALTLPQRHNAGEDSGYPAVLLA